MNGRPFRQRLLGVLYLSFLRAFLSASHLLFFCIYLFLRFRFRLGIINFRFLCEIVQIEKLLPSLSLSAENFPQGLLFFKLFWVNFCRFHLQLICIIISKLPQKLHTFQSSSKNFSIILKDRYFSFEKQIKKQATILFIRGLMMFANNSFGAPLQTIQNDLSQLQNQLLKLRLIMSQSPLHSTSSQIDLNSKLSSQLQALQEAISTFCAKYEGQIIKLHSKINLVFHISNGFAEKKQWKEDQKYFVINEKICVLERNLKKTQQNQAKLIETINILMAKYQINDQPTIIQNDEYLKSRIKTSQATSLITFQPCSGGTRRLSTQQLSTERDSLKKTIKKQHESIYLIKDKSSPFIPVRNHQSPQCIRNSSKQGHGVKISLKQTPGAYNQPKPTNKTANQSLDLKDKRSASLEKHEHRFKFMMDNLYY